MNVNATGSTNSSALGSLYSSKGLSGLMSGIDTETMVQKMLAGTQTKIDKQNTIKSQTTWKQELYQSVISDINTFKSKYIDSSYGSTLATNLTSGSFYNSTVSKVTSGDSVKVVGSSTASIEPMNITVNRLATAATLSAANESFSMSGDRSIVGENMDSTLKLMVGDTEVSVDLNGVTNQSDMLTAINTAAGSDIAAINGDGKLVLTAAADSTISVKSDSSALALMATGLTATEEGAATVTGATAVGENASFEFTLTLDGVSKTINLDIAAQGENGIITANSLAAALDEGVSNAFGGYVIVNYDNTNGNNKISFSHINATEKGHNITVTGIGTGLFGVKPGATSSFSTGTKLSELEGVTPVDGKVSFSINGKDFEFDATDDISTVMKQINNSEAGVKLSYSSIKDQFTMTATSTGANYGINIEGDDEGLFNKLFGEGTMEGGEIAVGRLAEGQDASITINEVTTSRSSNTFEIEGVTLQLTKTGDSTIETARDTDKIVDTFKSFVKDYNELIDKLTKYIEEKPEYKKFPPLTDAQKDEMTETEIKNWEAKTKVGLLYNDSYINSFLQSMRSALYTKPEGNAYAIYDIGIETDTWEKKGQLVIDESALRTALENDPDSVSRLFTDSTDGLAKKLEKVMNDTASTSAANPGLLVDYAGTTSATFKTNNTMYRTLQSLELKISDLKDKYDREKERYWNQFTAMETAMSSYNTQLSFLTSAFGS